VANAKTALIGAVTSQTALLSSRCIRSLARSANVQPLRLGRSLIITAAAYYVVRWGSLQPRLRPSETWTQQFQLLLACPSAKGGDRSRLWFVVFARIIVRRP
jgi:hypothetical protein